MYWYHLFVYFIVVRSENMADFFQGRPRKIIYFMFEILFIRECNKYLFLHIYNLIPRWGNGIINIIVNLTNCFKDRILQKRIKREDIYGEK